MRVCIATIALVFTACGGAPSSSGGKRAMADPSSAQKMSLDPAVVARVMTEHMAGFDTCRHREAATYISGTATLQFTIGADERVQQVHVIESDVGSWAIEGCLLQAARFLTFPLPEAGVLGTFRYPFHFNKLAQRHTAMKPESWGYAGLGAQRAAFDDCRQRYGFRGPFHLTAYIGNNGRPRSIGFHSRRPASDDFASCAVNAGADARFPPSTESIVKYRGLVEYLAGGR